jgi:hypothetical protein
MITQYSASCDLRFRGVQFARKNEVDSPTSSIKERNKLNTLDLLLVDETKLVLKATESQDQASSRVRLRLSQR